MKGIGVVLLFVCVFATFSGGSIISRKECSASDIQLFPHENCNRFYQCVNGALAVRNCPSNLLFNPETNECDWPANVDCDDEDNDDPNNPASVCKSGAAEGQFFVHENCNQYFRCIHGNLKEYACQQDLVFNHETLQCDWPYNVDCKEVTQLPETPDTTEAPVTEPVTVSSEETSNSNENDSSEENSSGSDSSEDNSEDASSEYDSQENDSSEADVNKICAAENSDGVLIAHEDCSKYYICSNSKPQVMNCPSDLLFNPETEQCDWPKNVHCGNNDKLYLKKKLEVVVNVMIRGKKNV